MGRLAQTHSFRTGTVRTRTRSYVLAADDELTEAGKPHTALLVWDNGAWTADILRWTGISSCLCSHPSEQILVMAELGDIYCIGSGDKHEEQVADGPIRPFARGTLRKSRAIGGRVYLAGMDRQVYRRDDRDRWTCIDASMRPPKDDLSVVGFESIDGFSDADIYAVGWDGAIWHFDGKSWRPIDSPVNIILTDVCCAPDGNVYVCGQKGIVLRGRMDTWVVLEHQATEEDFWCAVWFQDRLHLSTMRFVYALAGDVLDRLDFGDDFPGSCYHLSGAHGVLWSIGAKDIMSFDGREWTRIE